MSFYKQIFLLALVCLSLTSGCSDEDSPRQVPSDFDFMLDVRSVDESLAGNIHVNVRLDARGRGQFEYYDSGNGIAYDLNEVVIYDASQVLKKGKFELTDEELRQLWEILNQNHFFELKEQYQMALGQSYAFIKVEANGKRYMVDNIGMQVPEIKAIVEGIGALLPEEIKFEYGEGVTPSSSRFTD
jgi:hypothetical protein